MWCMEMALRLAYPSPAMSDSPPLQSDWWTCIPDPFSAKMGLGIRRRLPGPRGCVPDHVLEDHQLVGHPQQRLEAHADFALAT